MTISRAAWPHALHDKQQQQQQREKSRGEQTWVFRLLVFFWSGTVSRAWCTGLVVLCVFFSGMDDRLFIRWIHLSIKIIFLIELFEVYFLRPWWKNRE